MQQRIILLAFAVGLLLAGLPAAATLTTSPTPPPAEELILGYDSAGDVGSYLCSHGTGTAVDLGQTFRVSRASKLEKITLKVRAGTDQTPGELVTLSLGTFSGPADPSMNELLAVETRMLPSALPVGEIIYVTFDVADLPLEAGQQYGFLLGFAGGGHVSLARLDVLHVGGDAYSEGLAIDRAGALSQALPDDLAFFLHGTPSEEPPPDGAEALLLDDGRFRVEVAWEDFFGNVGTGKPVALTDASGYFWFFGPDNVELVVKVLDACSLEGFESYWVFAAGLTNVEVTMTVTDTLSAERKTYVNRMGEDFEPIMDTAAFATCDQGP